jgi:hypothetical protein
MTLFMTCLFVLALLALVLALALLPIGPTWIARLLRLWSADKARLYLNIMASTAFIVQRPAPSPAGGNEPPIDEVAQYKNITVTETQRSIVMKLWNLAFNLSNGTYLNINGAATMLLLGAKGIGKTITCQAFVNVCPIKLNIFCIHADCYNFCDNNHPLRLADLSTCVRLLLFGNTLYNAYSVLADDIVALDHDLATRGARAMIIVDELDEIYRHGKDSSVAMSTLGTLQMMGNSTLGRVSVILCGSSAQLPSLISTNDIKALETEFPLLAHGSPNLNGTKYSAQRVWAPSSTDVKLAMTIVSATLPTATKDAIRLLVFAIGTNPRELTKFAANHSFEPSDKRHSEMSTNFRNHQHARPFLNAILDALYKKNDKLLAGLTKGTGLQNLTWLESFQPLSEEEVGKLWARLLADRKINRTDKETQQATLFYL